MPNVFSVDLEDWFHLLDTSDAPPIEQWKTLEGRVERNADTLLAELKRCDVKATFFVLGWVAETYPNLVSEIARAGHEIASHGYAHRLIYQDGPEAFREDIRRANQAIGAAAGVAPKGFRAPGFSITADTPWAFDILLEHGYEYDSSVFPTLRSHGGIPGAERLPSVLENGIREFPISTVDLGLGRLAYLGGGYLRLLPRWLVLRLARWQERRDEPLILYLHPRDIDPHQPRLPLSPIRHARTYVGVAGCLEKISALLERFEWVPFRDYPAV